MTTKQSPDWWEKMLKYRNEQTSPRVGSLAATQLRDPRSTPAQKSVAGSALTQRPDSTLRKPAPKRKIKYPKP